MKSGAVWNGLDEMPRGRVGKRSCVFEIRNHHETSSFSGRLEQAVNEGRQRAALGQDEEQAEDQEEKHDRSKPPFFPFAEEAPEFLQDGEFIHLQRSLVNS